MQTLSDIGEDALIHRLVDGLPQGVDVLVGPGDDCAVVKSGAGQTLLKVDAVVEGVHFLREADPQLIGRKALARAVSDMAAMGGAPQHAMVTLVLPGDLEVAFVEGLYHGMRRLADEFGVSIVGGETVRGERIVVSIALTGEAEKPVLRSTARAGDFVVVTGRLGGSIAGHHFTFQPRVREAAWLVEHHQPSAMMDISDGLAKDLPRLAAASGVEFIVDGASLPRTPGASSAQAWGDGEDYELLFTIPPKSWDSLMNDWAVAFPDLPLTKIGQMVPVGQGTTPDFENKGWDHFAPKAT